MNWLVNTAAIILVTLCTIILFELLLIGILDSEKPEYVHLSRLQAEYQFCYGPKKHGYYDSTVINREHPNQQYFEFRNNVASLHTYNRFGFRGASEVAANHSGIIVIGDSFVRGSLADDTETIPAFLGSWFDGVTFFNFGIGGHGPSQYLLTYKEYAPKVDHDLVVLVLYLGNDALNELEFESKKAKARQVVSSKRTYIFKIKNYVKSFLASTEIAKLLIKVDGNLVSKENIIKTPIGRAKIVNILVDSVEKFTDEIHDTGKDVVIVTIPSREIYDTKMFPQKQYLSASLYTELAMDKLSEFAKSKNIPIIQMKDYFSTHNIEYEDVYGKPDTHFNEHGYYLTAVAIAEGLKENFDMNTSSAPKFVNRMNYDPHNLECP